MEIAPASVPAPPQHRPWRLAGSMIAAAPTVLIPLVAGTLFAGAIELAWRTAWQKRDA